MFPTRWYLLAVSMVLLAFITTGLHASTHEFFKGKTVRIIVGFSAGGGFDTYSRAIGRHIGRHIPGNPTVIVDNMPGASSIVAANYLYKIAKPDGLTVGNFHGNQILGQILGRQGIEFDARKFDWLGVPVQDNTVCAFAKGSGITGLDRWKAAKTPVKLGGVAPGDSTYDTAKVLKEATDLPLQLVSGYKGTAEIRLAAEGGEIAGSCWSWDSIKATWRRAIESGDAVVVLQVVPKPHRDLPNVPLATNLAKNEKSRLLIQSGVQEPSSIVRPYALPPGTPKERVQLLRKAFLETLKDPEFLVDAQKSRLEIDPLTGEELEKTVARLFKMDSGLVSTLKEILK